MSSPQPPFVLSRATEADIRDLLDLEYDCFDPAIRLIFMGCHSKADLPKTEQMYLKRWREDPHEIWIKVNERETGKLIAASNWKIHVSGVSNGAKGDDPPEWLEGEELEKSKAILEPMKEARAKAMPGPLVYLHICFTHEDYRRRGAGAMMLKWGCDIADLLGLPGWIEASVDGNLLYKTFDFYDFGTTPAIIEFGGMNMKRDAKTELAVGGKGR